MVTSQEPELSGIAFTEMVQLPEFTEEESVELWQQMNVFSRFRDAQVRICSVFLLKACSFMVHL